MLTLLAILPPEDISGKVAEWKNYMLETYGCKVALKSPAHITLIPPFQVPASQTDAMIERVDAFSLRHERFEVALHNFNNFAPRVIYVDVKNNKNLSAIKEALETDLLEAAFSIRKEDRPFHPHVTIANRDLDRNDFKPAWKYFSEMHYDASFTVDAITILQHNGNRWTVTFNAPLKPA